MIDYIRHVAIFTKVAEEESFSKAARSLGIAPSRVSESVSKLEHYLGSTLFNRTTRKIALTSEGRRLYEHTSETLESVKTGLNELRGSKAVPQGSLYISMPSYLSSSSLAQAIGSFIAQHPKVYINVEYTDHDVDPITNDYDVCIRSGQFRRNSLNVRQLGEVERVFVVGKGYLSNREDLNDPMELMNWDWINYRHEKRNYKLTSNEGLFRRLTIDKQARLQVDSIDALYSFACMDRGVTVMPLEFAKRGIKEQKLVQILSDWKLSSAKYYVIWPEKSRRQSLVSLFVDFLENELNKMTS